MSLNKKKLDVLTILYNNLQKTQPQLVDSTTIAHQMNVTLPELRPILKSMEGMGVIETDPDLQYNLITPKGLDWLDQQDPRAARSRSC